ncbi:uncharacterized protein LOC133187593 [Saccostrea echinata]|uniref:uncharacterized protein LOC133187593 n=1 Tax=Saccostrea echinata TaxID=191078 RepID=UPI002A82BDF6|nr:uncharacterized protein LOC133187593 [Saccostrea echinata]
MTVSILLMCLILPSVLIASVGSECIYYNYYNSIYSSYYHCYYEVPVGTIIGAVIGGIIGLIILCVIVAIICVVVCKKKTTGRVIQPSNVSAISTTATYNSYPSYPQQHGWGVQQHVWGAQPQVWGVHVSGPAYPGHGQHPPPDPVSQPMPPPTYAENVIQGQPPQNTN